VTTHCPHCLQKIPARHASRDGRCDWCPTRVGHRSLIHNRYLPDADELSAGRLNGGRR
jgi:hypothetical protein